MHSMKILLVILVGLMTVNTVVQGQSETKTRDRRENIKVIDPNAHESYKTSYPITRDTLNQFPDSLSIYGKLVDFTLGVSCGYFCGCGTMKIKLTRPNEAYKYEYLYIAFACFNLLPKEIRKRRQWAIYKLPLDDMRCYWTEIPMNKFDTGRLPFYIVKDHRRK
jgi:hypothetical protein